MNEGDDFSKNFSLLHWMARINLFVFRVGSPFKEEALRII
jgi:hypothetical protein